MIATNMAVTVMLVVSALPLIRRPADKEADLNVTGASLERPGVQAVGVPAEKAPADRLAGADAVAADPVLRAVFARGGFLVRTSWSPFFQTLQVDGRLNPELAKGVMNEKEYAVLEAANQRLRERLLNAEAELFEVVEIDGTTGINLPPILDREREAVEAFRTVLNDTLGEERGVALWKLISLTPDFVGMSGKRRITLDDGGDTYWNLRVRVSESLIGSANTESSSILKNRTFHDRAGAGDEGPVDPGLSKDTTFREPLGGRYAHILDMQETLRRITNHE